MNTVNNSYSVMSSLDHMKKCLEVRIYALHFPAELIQACF